MSWSRCVVVTALVILVNMWLCFSVFCSNITSLHDGSLFVSPITLPHKSNPNQAEVWWDQTPVNATWTHLQLDGLTSVIAFQSLVKYLGRSFSWNLSFLTYICLPTYHSVSWTELCDSHVLLHAVQLCSLFSL